MHIFYSEATNGNTVALSEEESYHAVKVLRLRLGQEVQITNGAGAWHKCRLVDIHSKRMVAEIYETTAVPRRPFNLHIAVAPPKNIDRFEWFLEKATECGIDEITPVFCANSERTSIKPERLKKILVSAMKQSLRAYLPVLNPETPLKTFLTQEFQAVTMIAHCKDGIRNTITEMYAAGQNAVLLIGPEGDFTMDEVQAALNKGYQPVTMGEYRLRTETAALAGCIHLNVINRVL